MTDVAQQGVPPAAATPGVTVELVHTEADARAAVAALAAVWPRRDGLEPLPPGLGWGVAHSGTYVSVARAGEEVVGAAIGFRGEDEDGSHLHSHIAGVRREWQGSN